MRKGRRQAVYITLPKAMIDALDEVAKELNATRSYVVEALIEYAFAYVDEIFPYEEEGETEEEPEEE